MRLPSRSSSDRETERPPQVTAGKSGSSAARSERRRANETRAMCLSLARGALGRARELRSRAMSMRLTRFASLLAVALAAVTLFAGGRVASVDAPSAQHRPSRPPRDQHCASVRQRRTGGRARAPRCGDSRAAVVAQAPPLGGGHLARAGSRRSPAHTSDWRGRESSPGAVLALPLGTVTTHARHRDRLIPG